MDSGVNIEPKEHSDCKNYSILPKNLVYDTVVLNLHLEIIVSWFLKLLRNAWAVTLPHLYLQLNIARICNYHLAQQMDAENPFYHAIKIFSLEFGQSTQNLLTRSGMDTTPTPTLTSCQHRCGTESEESEQFRYPSITKYSHIPLIILFSFHSSMMLVLHEPDRPKRHGQVQDEHDHHKLGIR
ncbi:hypothetical protein H5410_023248 [Solanum commersonii]|uniref:Uncharacterized protein n=1 Tax=Solanum commersonii TaxID=4109 RepID=A0A9J5ZIP9_SOLCO|nr:hypothetical protein H5410_023248 [Solanum commersonii]